MVGGDPVRKVEFLEGLESEFGELENLKVHMRACVDALSWVLKNAAATVPYILNVHCC